MQNIEDCAERTGTELHAWEKVIVTTAIAREMVGFIWAIAQIAQPALTG
jgi:hypothetical protein